MTSTASASPAKYSGHLSALLAGGGVRSLRSRGNEETVVRLVWVVSLTNILWEEGMVRG